MTVDAPFATELLNAISNLVAVVENGAITYINPAGVSILAAGGAESLIGRDLAEFIHADYADLIALGIEAFAEEEAGVPLKMRPLNAAPIDVLLRVQPLDGGSHMVECRDITSFIQSAEEARRREQRLAGVLGAVADAIVTIDVRGTMQSVNPATERIFGFTKAEMIGQSVNLLMPVEHADTHDAHIRDHMEKGTTRAIGNTREMIGKRKDGTVFPIEVSVAELHEGGETLFTGVIRDITDRKKAEAEIQYLAHHDALTGLPNRNLYVERVERAVHRAKRSGKVLALMFIDLDKFKPVNDLLGHEAGDLVLKTVAARLKHCVRESDTVARLGGDEFVAILENLDHWQSAKVVAEKILKSVPEPIVTATGDEASVGTSIGISVYPHDGHDVDELTNAADQAMYAVKQAGRGNYKFFCQLPERNA
ncbi:MAG: diguanylate cyclase [Alphaproteobacteria bacterium]|nr:diguanylate cyclase [Alphaproteobacteria bacterium]